MPSAGNPEKSEVQTKPLVAKAAKKTRANKKKAGTARSPAATTGKEPVPGQRPTARLRPNDLIWGYVANNWLLGNKPPVFDVLAWNADSTRLPAEFHADLLSISSLNPLVRKNQLKVRGTPIDMSKVKQDNYIVAGITVYITPWQACYESRKILAGDDELCGFRLVAAGFVNAVCPLEKPQEGLKAR